MLTLRKRGKYFHVRGTIRVGRETRFVTEHSSGADRRDDANDYKAKLEAEIRQEILHGPRGRAHSLTIGDAGLRYFNRPGVVAPGDLRRINDINGRVGNYPLARSGAAWIEFKRQRCGGLAPSTVQRFRSTFSAMVNYLANEEEIDLPKLPRGDRILAAEIRFLTAARADRLIAAYAEHARPIAITLRWQGPRVGEALRIEWPHVDWRRNTIFIPETKNGRPRTLSMHKLTRAALHKLWVERGSPGEGRVFLTNRGEPYHDTREYKTGASGSPIKKTHATACMKAGIANFSTHDWRHHWACHCVMSGIDLETLKQEGGWSSLRMVERYATVSASHRKTAMQKLK